MRKKQTRKRKGITKRKAKRSGAVRARGIVAAGWVPYNPPAENPPPPPPPPPSPLAGPVVELGWGGESGAVALAVFQCMGAGPAVGAVLQVGWSFVDIATPSPVVVGGVLANGIAILEPVEVLGTDLGPVFQLENPWIGSVQPQVWDGTLVQYSCRWKSTNGVENLWSDPLTKIVEP